ncbi:MAG: hypothetical protein Q8P57_01215 [Candidatus Pacearchaeota archaeon]|nr:hypothetical protein [Candidatus Pacearchaeota archaeon]
MEIEDIKKKYGVLKKKYNLPSFDEVDSDFGIGKIENFSGDILKEIRGAMMEKVVHYVRLMEMMISPSQNSPVFMVFLREINEENKSIMNKVLKSFVGLELSAFRLDIDSKQTKEAEQINKIFTAWNNSKKDLNKLIDMMESNWNGVQKENKSYRGYFG